LAWSSAKAQASAGFVAKIGTHRLQPQVTVSEGKRASNCGASAQIREWDECGFGNWAARTRAEGRIIGYVGLSVPTFLPDILPAVEAGWRFTPSAWGQGYATEGATAALDDAFGTLGLDRVCSVPQADNPPSARVAERLGMSLVRQVTIPAKPGR
jgi:RimJ/RimL family protein N-acetyltransferase